MRRVSLTALLLLAALTGFVRPLGAATITIVNNDGSGEGFNDPTARAPVGGNGGTTLGAQRLNVFNQAAAIWGNLLPSGVTIRVRANFDALTCSSNSAVLGQAGTLGVYAGFSDAAFADTWYHSALANRIAGRDLDATADDIGAFFNSRLDDPDCLGTTGWYYGFDHVHGNDSDLLAVVLHELGHGLGFSTFADHTSGELFAGMPDVYLHFIYDDAADMAWTAMNDTQRAASAINYGHVVWSGASVTEASPGLLNVPALRVRVESPPSIARDYDSQIAEFGPPASAGGVTALVALVNDGSAPNTDACTAISNGSQVAGKFALIDRGNCTFVVKAAAAQAAGAVGAIIVNNVDGPAQEMTGSAPGLTIPVVSLSLADGNLVKSALLSGPVQMTVGLHPTRRAGANAADQVLLYAPSPANAGSSISHWDITATPNLLMEPFLTDDLTSDVDLTLNQMEDIGWFGPGGSGPGATPAAIVEALDGYPNPFGAPTASSATVRFLLDRRAAVEATIIDLNGRLIRTLARDTRDAGTHSLEWNGADDFGNAMRSGVYLFRIRAGSRGDAKRIVLTR